MSYREDGVVSYATAYMLTSESSTAIKYANILLSVYLIDNIKTVLC